MNVTTSYPTICCHLCKSLQQISYFSKKMKWFPCLLTVWIFTFLSSYWCVSDHFPLYYSLTDLRRCDESCSLSSVIWQSCFFFRQISKNKKRHCLTCWKWLKCVCRYFILRSRYTTLVVWRVVVRVSRLLMKERKKNCELYQNAKTIVKGTLNKIEIH